MKSKFLNYLLIILLLSSASCIGNWYKPGSRVFKHVPKDGSDGLKAGWMDGCESGLATSFGGNMYMSFYSWKRDHTLIANQIDYASIYKRYGDKWKNINWNNKDSIDKSIKDYNLIFWRAHIFCRHFVLQNLNAAGGKVPGVGTDTVGINFQRHLNIGDVFSLHGNKKSFLSAW